MKRKITIAVAVMLVLVMALSSCGAKGTKIEKILNADYDISADVYGEANNVSELDGYVIDTTKSNTYFLVFTRADVATGSITTKIMSLYTGKVVSTFTTTDTVLYTIETFPTTPVYLVTNTPVGENAGDPSYILYDATGESVVTTSYKPAAPYKVGDDLVIYNYVGYTVDDDGKLEKKMDIPEYVAVKGITDANDKFYYVINSNSFIVYDFEFNEVSHWTAPSYAKNIKIFALNNGDLFVQYNYTLDEDATEFDYYDANAKYDLVTLVISAKNAKAKEVKLDYSVITLIPNYRMYDEDNDNNKFTDKFENLALIAPIVNKNIDMSQTAMEFVVLGNNGKIKSVLDYVEDMDFANIGDKVGDDLYLVSTVTSQVLINGNGNVVKTFNNKSALGFVGGYAVGSVAIYDMDFEIVYNLLENDAKVEGYVGDTIFVKVTTDTGYEIISFNGGEQKTILTYTDEADNNDYFDVLDNNIYYVLNGVSGEYTYYNANGDVMIKSTTDLDIETYGKDIVVLSAEVDGTMKYYVASIENAD